MQATSLLTAVQRQPADAADVEAVQAAIDEALCGAAAALEACADLEERCRSRLQFAAAAGEAEGVQAELACIGDAAAAWQGLQAAAAERQAQGVSVPPLLEDAAAGPAEQGPAAEASAAAETVGGEVAGEGVRRPASSVRGSLARTDSSVSAASSVASRASVARQQQRKASRLLEEEAA